MRMRIEGGRALVGAALEETSVDLDCEGGIITGVGAQARAERAIDARGLLVLPGIVDVHGDAFERQMMPRPGVGFPIDVALLESDRQAVANGITTVFHGVTWSWEGGLRGAENARDSRRHRALAAPARRRHPLPPSSRNLQSRCRGRDHDVACQAPDRRDRLQ